MALCRRGAGFINQALRMAPVAFTAPSALPGSDAEPLSSSAPGAFRHLLSLLRCQFPPQALLSELHRATLSCCPQQGPCSAPCTSPGGADGDGSHGYPLISRTWLSPTEAEAALGLSARKHFTNPYLPTRRLAAQQIFSQI